MDTLKRQLSVVRCPLSVGKRSALNDGPRTTDHGSRTAFTLIELLVVITIIGILAALITVAAVGALKTAQRTRIKAEINEMSNAIDEYKNKTTAYPPNCQTDDKSLTAEPVGSSTPIEETQALNDLKRHLRQAFPRHQESDDLILRLLGLAASAQQLKGGMTAGEALVFWLGGFSADPKYPISGEGGPSYLASAGNSGDPVESRKWVFPFDVGRLGPRDSSNYFDDSAPAGQRYIEYSDPRYPTDSTKLRRINFWQYAPAKSDQPYLYFDTSRHPAYDVTAGVPPSRFDPPAATDITKLGPGGAGLHVHAFKKQNGAYSATNLTAAPIEFINPDKFQVLHCGLDEAWGESDFERMSAHTVATPNKPDNYLLFPTGPFIGDVADTEVNFAPETKIEDAQK